MGPPVFQNATAPPRSILWVDYAKGFCIILVVMMHSTLGVGEALGREGWLHEAVAFARPFRVPTFFLIAGLFLARTIDKPWPDYLSRKVGHFVYLYVLWLLINCVVRFHASGPVHVLHEIALGLIDPFGSLWFIYVLPLFFLAAKLGRRAPAAMWLVAAALQIAPIETQWYAIDQFAERWVYFLTGYIFASHAFTLASWAQRRPCAAAGWLGVWFVAAALQTWGRQEAAAPITLLLAHLGAVAVIIASAQLAASGALRWIAVCGARSLPIYLAFFFPMVVTRSLVVRYAPEIDPTLASIIVTSAAVCAPMALHAVVKSGPLFWLFARPTLPRGLTQRTRDA